MIERSLYRTFALEEKQKFELL